MSQGCPRKSTEETSGETEFREKKKGFDELFPTLTKEGEVLAELVRKKKGQASGAM